MLGPVESAFLNHGQVQQKVEVGLGATSQVSGKCIKRHFNTGACWGTFDGTSTSAVDNRDPVSCSSDGYNLTEAVSSTGNSASVRSDGPWVPNTASHYNNSSHQSGPCSSYGTYSNCSNCVGNSYGNYSFPNCYSGSNVLTTPCDNRERMRSIYDTRVQASSCNGDGPSKMFSDYASGGTSKPITYGIEYAGQLDPFRQNPYHLKSYSTMSSNNMFGTFDDAKYCNL